MPFTKGHKAIKYNELDKTYDRLYVKAACKDKNGKSAWLCDCKCGKEYIALGNALRSGDTTSCGCGKKLRVNGRWCGFEEISGAFWKVIQNGAKARKIEFNLTIEYVWNLFVSQNRKCKFSGVELVFVRKYNEQAKTKQTASLDRIDSTKGYIEGNVQWVHKNINRMKNNMSDEQFIEWCTRVAKHNEIV